MSKFTMVKSFEGEYPINTDDFLAAVKHSLNYEADLYYNGRLVCSWLGLEMEENIESLEKIAGITAEVKNNRWCFKYIDESKNTGKVYAQFNQYLWDKEMKLEVQIHDYAEPRQKNFEFNNIDEVIEHVKNNIVYTGRIKADNIYISAYIDGQLTKYEDRLFYNCSIEECTLGEEFCIDCKCKDCISNKKTSKGCVCQSREGCYKLTKEALNV